MRTLATSILATVVVGVATSVSAFADEDGARPADLASPGDGPCVECMAPMGNDPMTATDITYVTSRGELPKDQSTAKMLEPVDDDIDGSTVGFSD